MDSEAGSQEAEVVLEGTSRVESGGAWASSVGESDELLVKTAELALFGAESMLPLRTIASIRRERRLFTRTGMRISGGKEPEITSI